MRPQNKEDYITVKTRRYVSKVHLSRILYIFRESRKINILSTDRSYNYYQTMDYIRQKVGDDFFFPLQGLCVNMAHINHVDKDGIVFDTGNVLQLSPEAIAKTKPAFFKYLKENE